MAEIPIRFFNAELLRNRLWSFEALVHLDIAKSWLGAVELQCASVAQILPSHEFLLLRIQIILDGNSTATWHTDMLRANGCAPPGLVLVKAKLHLHVLDKLREAISSFNALVINIDSVAWHKATLGQFDETKPGELAVFLNSSGVRGSCVDLLTHLLADRLWTPL